MTREEAIYHLKTYDDPIKVHEAFDMAISALDQEPCENCDHSEIVDWEQDAKTGKAKPIYWCERHKKPCDDEITISVRADANGYYPNVCGMCANAESELCDWCGDNKNFRKIGMSEELVEHYKKLADHYNKHKGVQE